MSFSLRAGLGVRAGEGRGHLASHGVHAGEAHQSALVKALRHAQHVTVARKVIHLVNVYSVLEVRGDAKREGEREEDVRGEKEVARKTVGG